MRLESAVFTSALLALASAATVGCDGQMPAAGDENALIALAITGTPSDVACLRATVTGATRTAVRSIVATTGQAISTKLSGLPTGQVQVLLEGFAVACAAVSATSEATWLSDSIPLTLVRGVPVPLKVSMRENGRINLEVDFIYDNQCSNLATANLSAGLVARFPLDSNALDVGPNTFSSVLTGTTPAPDRNGNPSGALRFDGVADRIAVPFATFQSMSVSVWMKVPHDAGNGNTAYPTFVDLYNSTTGVESLTFGHNIRPSLGADSGVIWALNNVHTSQTNLWTVNTYHTDVWYHVVYTFDAGTKLMSMFVDGALENSVLAGASMNVFDSLSIGADMHSSPETHFAGVLDELVIYRRVLSGDEISELYQGNIPVVCPSPPGV